MSGNTTNTSVVDEDGYNYLACIDLPEIECSPDGVGDNSTFVFTACASGVHSFSLDWGDGDPDDPLTSTALFLEQGQVYQDSHVYTEAGNNEFYYKIVGDFEGTNDLTLERTFQWDVQQDTCVPFTNQMCVDRSPDVDCMGVNQTSTFSYTACGAGTHVFTFQWELDDFGFWTERDLQTGEVFTTDYIYDSQGKKLFTWKVVATFLNPGGITGILTHGYEREFDVREDTCTDYVEPTMPPEDGSAAPNVLASTNLAAVVVVGMWLLQTYVCRIVTTVLHCIICRHKVGRSVGRSSNLSIQNTLS